jgi:hypothetical protein
MALTPGNVPARFAISVVPSLVGFASLLPENAKSGIWMQIVAFNALLAYDLISWRRGRVNAWYPTLRVWLTAGVSASLLSTVTLTATKRKD